MDKPKTPSLAERALAAHDLVAKDQARAASEADAHAEAVREAAEAWLAAAFPDEPAEHRHTLVHTSDGAQLDYMYARLGNLDLRVAVAKANGEALHAELVIACPGCHNEATVPVAIPSDEALARLGEALAYGGEPNCATCLTGPKWNP